MATGWKISIAPFFISNGDLTLKYAAVSVSLKAFIWTIDAANARVDEDDVNDTGGGTKDVGNGGSDGRPCVSRIV